jgi:L-amino acid N-acyltransferase YncA
VIALRTVETAADIDTYLDVRNRVHPERPMPRDALLDLRRQLNSLDLIAELDGVPVGAGSVARFGGAPDGDLAYLTLRVLRDARRRGVGTALDRRASEHARALGKHLFTVAVRHDDTDSLEYFAARRFDEVGRMQDVRLDLSAVDISPELPTGIEIIPALTSELERGAYAVALEADADIPAGVPIESGTFDRWRERHFGERTIQGASFVAVENGRVVGYAILGRHTDDAAQHWMTGVARTARGRGIALALKQAQIAAAKSAGWKYLDTQNDLANAPMRRVNEKLGYERRFEWVHLTGPLLDD